MISLSTVLTTIPMEQLNVQLDTIIKYFEKFEFLPLIHAMVYFFIGLCITLVVRWFVGKLAERNISYHHSLLFRRIIFYLGLTLSLIYPLRASGVDVTAILGAAGLLGAAVAFASQTSISNFLSGVFLEAEKPFVIGDYVKVNDVIGEVLSIDLLSVKIRTKDNVLVRIPNESLLKSQFRNESRFPIRRFDIKLRVSFNEDLEKLKRIVLNAADKNPLCLKTPAPELSFVEFGEAAVIMQFSVWGKQSTYANLQTSIQMDIQAAFNSEKFILPTSPVTLINA